MLAMGWQGRRYLDEETQAVGHDGCSYERCSRSFEVDEVRRSYIDERTHESKDITRPYLSGREDGILRGTSPRLLEARRTLLEHFLARSEDAVVFDDRDIIKYDIVLPKILKKVPRKCTGVCALRKSCLLHDGLLGVVIYKCY
jgi:hypothetical protein